MIGYKNQEGGQYGLERYFDDVLSGTNGVFKAKLDGLGQSLTVGDDTVITPAEDGADIYLSIDRSIQLMTERILAEAVESYDADSGQVIIMKPSTGEVLAMANYPSFNLNDYSAALDKEEFVIEEEEDYAKIERLVKDGQETIWFHDDQESYKKTQLFPVKSETGERFILKSLLIALVQPLI